MQIQNPYHHGEVLAQELAGERASAERNAVVIADTIMAGALSFLRQQDLFVVGSSSPAGQLWASVLFGPRGFLESGDGKTLLIRFEPGSVDSLDPFWTNISSDPRLGGLAIELATRRRLRINGRVAGFEPGLLTVAVDEAYPNCPKYIQRRFLKPGASPGERPAQGESGSEITDTVREIIQAADTMFVASSNPGGGVDVSHRGGPPGFVTFAGERFFSVPDYHGNSMFNTLGNFSVNPAVGILIIDFLNGRVLQTTGSAKINWEKAESAGEGTHAGRRWTFSVDRWLLRPLAVPYEWEFLDYSPFNPK